MQKTMLDELREQLADAGVKPCWAIYVISERVPHCWPECPSLKCDFRSLDRGQVCMPAIAAMSSRLSQITHAEQSAGPSPATIAERLLRLEVLFVDPAEVAKLSDDELREMASMPGGDLQLSRFTKLEDRVALLEKAVARS